MGLEQPTDLGDEGNLDRVGINFVVGVSQLRMKALKKAIIVESNQTKTLTYIEPFRGRERSFESTCSML